MIAGRLNSAVALVVVAGFSLSACSDDEIGGGGHSSDTPADAAATVRQAIADHGSHWVRNVDEVASIMPATVGIVVHDLTRPQAADMCGELNDWTGGDYALAVESKDGSDLAICGRITSSQQSDPADNDSAAPKKRAHETVTIETPAPESTPAPEATTTTSIDSPSYNENGDIWLTTALEGIDLPEVRQIQQQLLMRGYSVVVDGSYGPQTAAAVRQFQAEHGITVDGVVGPETFRYLVYVSGN